MSPRRAILIVLALFLMTAAGFTFLYLKRQLTSSVVDQTNMERTISGQTSDRIIETKKISEQEVKKVIEEAKKNPTPVNQAAARQAMTQTLDAIKTNQAQPIDNKAAEQKAAAMNALLEQISSKKK